MQEIWPHELTRHRATYSRLKIVVSFSKLVPSNKFHWKFISRVLRYAAYLVLERNNFHFSQILHRKRWATSRDNQRKFLVLISTSKEAKEACNIRNLSTKTAAILLLLTSHPPTHTQPDSTQNSSCEARVPAERAASPLSGIWTHPMRKKGSARDEILISGRESRKKNFPFFSSSLRASPCAYFSLL